jgi:LPXTG-motif cell wall-anchored protein
VTGTVFSVSPPESVVLTLEDGKNQKFDIPDGQKFDVQGKTVDAFGLKRGMKVSAARIVQVPATATTQQRSVTGTMPPPPPPNTPILIAQSEPTQPPPPPPAETAKPEKLPVTGSPLPMLGLVGAVSLCLGLLLGVLRRRRTA